MWLRRHLRTQRPGSVSLIDIGCGTGAFTIGAALEGFESLGLSWDVRNQEMAQDRASLCGASLASFKVCDVRELDAHAEWHGRFDLAICLETIEHILDDRRLLCAISRCLKTDGRLLLTTPNIDYHPITKGDNGPFLLKETGWHVRKGYSATALTALCNDVGLMVTEVSYCSGFTSQKITGIMRWLSRVHPLAGWTAILPLRLLPLVMDPIIRRLTRWPDFSICLDATKADGKPVSEN